MRVPPSRRQTARPGADAAQFRGFGPEALSFFAGLAAENTRDWFLAHKAEYEQAVKGPAMDLVADLCTALAAREAPLHGEPGRALFRVNRDVRFARDKSPYKTNVSFVLSRSGGKHDPGLLYVQHGVGGSFAAAGFYGLDAPQLAAFRAWIVERPDAWRGVEAALSRAGLALSREGATTRLPRGFRPDDVGDLADALKLKGYLVSRPLPPDALADPAVVATLADFAAAALPLLEFGWRALEPRG